MASKRHGAVAEKLKELNIDPVAGMVRIAQTAENAGNLALAGRMFSELLEYAAPKLKAVEHSFDDETLETLSPELRRLRILELQRRLKMTGDIPVLEHEPDPAAPGE